MPLVAKLDTTQTPAVVIAVYNFLDPSYMVAPVFLDVTTVTPKVVLGCTWDGKKWAWPAQPVDLVAWAQQQIGINEAYIAAYRKGSPNDATNEAQLNALSTQMNLLIRRRIGGV